jgi:thiol-disulfide isomerase/thioredoxin
MSARRSPLSLAWPGVALAASICLASASTAGEGPAVPPVVAGDARMILQAIQRPGATAVLVNVWATWCDACREEMPRLVRFYRDHRAAGLRFILISADEESERARAAKFLAAQGVDVPSWLKRGDDMAFIDALDRRWTGTLPASWLFDGNGKVVELWQRPVTVPDLEGAWSRVLPSQPRPSPAQKPTPSRRNP